MTIRSCLCLMLLVGAGASAGPTDKPADFVIDLSSVCDEPIGIQVRTKRRLWQLPRSRVRKGFGLAWYWIERASSNSSEARIYVEVEALGDRPLADAVRETAESLEALMEPFHTELVGDVRTGEKERLKVGRVAVDAYRLHYRVDITTAVPRSVSPATAIVFEHEKALVTITVEDFDTKKDYVDPFLKSMSLVKLPLRPEPIRLKMVDATQHIYRYMTCVLPAGLAARHADTEYGDAATFATPADEASARIQVTCRRIQPPRGRNMTFAKAVEWIRSSYADMYSDVSPSKETRIGGTPGYVLSYTDKEGGPWRVHTAFISLHDQMWTWTLKRTSAGGAEIEKASAEFEKLLKSGRLWVVVPE